MSSPARSPSLEEMYRRRPSFDRPPIRELNSPRLTEEEADQLTSPFLNYSTRYTYAFSQAYNPDKPPAWEVPNMINNNLSIASPGYDEYAPYHFSAPSLFRKTFQAGSSLVWFMISSVLWLLHAVTIRPVKAVGLLLYDTVDWMLYRAARLGEWVSGSVYKRRDHRADHKYGGSPSNLQMISILFWKTLYFLGGVIRAPVDLVTGSVRAFNLALTRMYHTVLAKQSRQIRANAAMQMYEPSQQRLYFSDTLKYPYTKGEDHDSDFIDDEEDELEDPEQSSSPTRGYSARYHQKLYNLRSRHMNAYDSEDDSPRGSKSVRFETECGRNLQLIKNARMRNAQRRNMSKATRIATWLGSTASSIVYYLQSGVLFAGACIRAPFDVAGQAISYVSPQSASSRKSPLRLRSGNRYDLRSRKISDDAWQSGSESSSIASDLKSLAAYILYSPCRAFLFVAFAAADLCRWLYSRVPAVFMWFWDTTKALSSAVLTRRRRWLWWLLPLLILLLLLLSRRNADDRLIILGHDISDLHEKVSNYAYSIVDSDGVYAKSLNSIYDEYWRSGKISRYSIFSKVTGAISNAYLFVTTVFKTFVDLIATSLSDLTTAVIDFFASTSHDTYSKLPSVAYFKSSAHDVLASTEKHLSHGFGSVSNFASVIVTGLRNWFNMVWSGIMSIFVVIGGLFQRQPLAIIEQKATELEHEPLQTTSTVQDYINMKPPNIVYVPTPSPSIDEGKLIEKITAIVKAKMDQDLKIKLENELRSLKASYEQKLTNLKVEKNRADFDYARLEALIRTAINEYDSDKTGMFDFALESAGASIISTRCSENYDTYTRLEKIWNIPLWYSSYGPRTVIQRNSKTLFPGECWSFKGSVGYITIGLSHPINATIVSYEHIGAHQAPGGQRPSAPKTFKIWAYKSEADMETRVLLGDFMYDINGPPLQFFVINTQPDYPVQIIEMEVTSNYGAEYTSLYRLRVHGSLYKPGV
ncbi:hypothetical protein V3C99_017425 [Haemonchus contortus]